MQIVEQKKNKFVFCDKEYKLSAYQIKQLGKDSSLILGIRPFNITIGDSGKDAVVNYSEVDGNDLLIHCNFLNQEVIVVEKNLNDVGLKYIKGQNIKLEFDDNYFYIFTNDEKGICGR